MKKKALLTLAAALGVFLMIDIPLLAQSTGRSSSSETKRESSREATREPRRSIYVAPEIEIAEMVDFDHGFAYTTGTSTEKNSKLSLSKRYSGQSASKTGTFDIEEGVRKIRISIAGSVVVGKINLELYLPGKKELKKISIDDSADITWSQSINIKEGDTKYYGEWTYVINAQSVEGKYNMSISTY